MTVIVSCKLSFFKEHGMLAVPYLGEASCYHFEIIYR